jgi:hypothetical protein
VSETHDWQLVAPWYRWLRQIGPGVDGPRETRPVLQKYEDPKLVAAFLAEPQRSLKFDDDDWVYEVSAVAARRIPAGQPLADKVAEPAVQRGTRFEKYLATKTSIRKLFLDSHRRHYLVVCELHCDVPGFPCPDPHDPCQAGFVVRRRYTSYPQAAEPEAADILKELAKLQLKLAKLDRVPAAKRLTKRWELLAPQPTNGAAKAERFDLQMQIARQRKELRRWAAENNVTPAQLGWIPSERQHVGSWQVVEEEPQLLLEGVYPLYPLFASPNDPEHSAQGSAIFFGIVPTASFDHDPAGNSRYDDRHLYDIRCFVRRHKPHCPRTRQPNDCNGELFWSRPTEPFRVAAHFDPVGTAHRPVNIKLPDFPALAAAAASRPVGALSPVAMNQPNRSSLNVGPGLPPSGNVGGGQICFLAIPLITIVAWFVLNIFLPIVVFVFGLWFLLRLKICIPPSLSVQAGVDAYLAPIEADFSLAASAGFDLDVGGAAPHTANAIHGDLTSGLAGVLGAPDTSGLDPFSNNVLADFERQLTKPQQGPDFSGGVEWEDVVTRDQVEALVA